MRIIKFRAWDKEQKRMYFNVQDAYDTLGSHFSEDQEADRTEDWHYFYPSSFGAALTEENLEIMQFTGLLDKNGKEIYEGDILKDDRNCKWEVKWKNTGEWSCSGEPEKYYEIIGNIYENKELLK